MPRIALISDIHANLEAFEAVLADVRASACEVLVCLGDVVGYGPDPGACVDLAYESCDVILIGNHDEAALGRPRLGAFNEAAAVAIEYSRNNLTKHQCQAISYWERRTVVDGVSLTHGSFGPQRFAYITGRAEAADALAAMDTTLGAVGHTHIPSIFNCGGDITSGEDVGCLLAPVGVNIVLPQFGRLIVNPGSVGQPRDGNPDASWAILDTDKSTFCIHRVVYDIDKVQSKISAAGLPDMLGERLKVGA